MENNFHQIHKKLSEAIIILTTFKAHCLGFLNVTFTAFSNSSKRKKNFQSLQRTSMISRQFFLEKSKFVHTCDRYRYFFVKLINL